MVSMGYAVFFKCKCLKCTSYQDLIRGKVLLILGAIITVKYTLYTAAGIIYAS